MKELLKGKNIVVTGADGGIGSAIVKVCAEQGANVWACCLDGGPKVAFSELQAEYGTWIEVVELNLSDAGSIKSAVKAIRSRREAVDGLVNCAGIMGTSSFVMTTSESLNNQLNINFVGPYELTQMIVKLMTRNKAGSIVSFASTNALDGTKGKTAYGASKAAVIAMTQSLANEVGSLGIRANCVAPSAVKTSLLDGISQEAMDEMMANTALGRLCDPEEVANVVAFLLSDYSSYVTGQCIRIDGGLFA